MCCSYCTREKAPRDMSEDVLIKACDLAFSKGKSAGLSFFGGEPMLKKELIIKAIEYCKEKEKQSGKKFRSKMTTNGTMLDEKFLSYAKLSGLEIAISYDGTAQDICRRFADGGDSGKITEEKARLLLSFMPDSYAMLTLAPVAVAELYNSVKHLYDMGFRKISVTPAYGKNVSWNDGDIKKLENELLKVADFYSNVFKKDIRLFFGPFDSKINACIRGTSPKDHCQLGIRQMTVTTDGILYPCTQFIGKEAFCLGNVENGINTEKQYALSLIDNTPKECLECDLKDRCTNSCGCANILETGEMNRISPLQCTYERMLIKICDDMAERLYNKYPEQFRKRFTR